MIGPPKDEDEAFADAYVERHFAPQARAAQEPTKEPAQPPEDDENAAFDAYMAVHFGVGTDD